MCNIYNPEDFAGINRRDSGGSGCDKNDPKIGLFTTNFDGGFLVVGLLYADTPTERPAAVEPFYNPKSLVIITVLLFVNGTLLSLAQALGHKWESQK
jgi:hypothetical protein